MQIKDAFTYTHVAKIQALSEKMSSFAHWFQFYTYSI